MHTCRIYKKLVQMVQMKQLPGKKGRCRHREWTVDTAGEAEVEEEFPKKTRKSCQSLEHTEIRVLAAHSFFCVRVLSRHQSSTEGWTHT